MTPPTAAADDNAAGASSALAFTPSVDGTITAIRFYKGPGNTGTHLGSLWTSDGDRLGTVTFTNETASGWQTATLRDAGRRSIAGHDLRRSPTSRPTVTTR